jgi:hypothetical protein
MSRGTQRGVGNYCSVPLLLLLVARVASGNKKGNHSIRCILENFIRQRLGLMFLSKFFYRQTLFVIRIKTRGGEDDAWKIVNSDWEGYLRIGRPQTGLERAGLQARAAASRAADVRGRSRAEKGRRRRSAIACLSGP